MTTGENAMERGDFTLQQLRNFQVVAQELHFGRAARRLHLTQPPLSRSIQALERAIGTTLLQRTSRAVALTPAGQRLQVEAAHVLESADRAVRLTRLAASRQIGTLSIGFLEPFGFELMPQILMGFRHDFPALNLELAEMHTYAQVAALHDRTMDLGILRPPIQTEGLHVERLFSEQLILAYPSSRPEVSGPVRVKDLADDRFVIYAPRIGEGIYRTFLSACMQAGFTPTVAHEASSTPLLLSLIEAGEGVSFVSPELARVPRPGVRFAALSPRPMCTISLVWREDDDHPAYSSFLDHARAVIGGRGRRAARTPAAPS
jgi:DNA-binding transcriptional LysR family regulator